MQNQYLKVKILKLFHLIIFSKAKNIEIIKKYYLTGIGSFEFKIISIKIMII